MEVNTTLLWLECLSWLKDTELCWVAMIPAYGLSHISKVRLSGEHSAILQTLCKLTLGAFTKYGCPATMPHLLNHIPRGRHMGGQGWDPGISILHNIPRWFGYVLRVRMIGVRRNSSNYETDYDRGTSLLSFCSDQKFSDLLPSKGCIEIPHVRSLMCPRLNYLEGRSMLWPSLSWISWYLIVLFVIFMKRWI